MKQQRLVIAQEEVQHLNDTLANWKASRTSCKYFSIFLLITKNIESIYQSSCHFVKVVCRLLDPGMLFYDNITSSIGEGIIPPSGHKVRGSPPKYVFGGTKTPWGGGWVWTQFWFLHFLYNFNGIAPSDKNDFLIIFPEKEGTFCTLPMACVFYIPQTSSALKCFLMATSFIHTHREIIRSELILLHEWIPLQTVNKCLVFSQVCCLS